MEEELQFLENELETMLLEQDEDCEVDYRSGVLKIALTKNRGQKEREQAIFCSLPSRDVRIEQTGTQRTVMVEFTYQWTKEIRVR